jgi:cytochrome c-type biogenesis protein CcmH
VKLLLVLWCAMASAQVPDAVDVAAPAAAADPRLLAEPPDLDPPDVEAARLHAEVLSGSLRCPVCQGMSVADSPSDGARAMKARIVELVELGYSDAQIRAYFVDRYGTWVLLEPPAVGLHQLIYIAPLVVVVVGLLAGLLFAVRRGAATRPVVPPPAPAPTAKDDALAPWRQRVLDELEQGGGR